MSKSNSESRIAAELAQFEQRLETPVVPGELANWIESVREAAATVASSYPQLSAQEHAEILADILRRDLALASRVEEMKKTDVALVARGHQLADSFAKLGSRAVDYEPDEAALGDEVESLSRDALQFIIDVRKQGTALTTWYMEAFDRDRGAGD